jgi:hypothetical protein
MPYEYRKLSPQEREEIVKYRRMHGYPLHAPPHPFQGTGSYLITAANFEHHAIMSSPERRSEFEIRLLNSIKDKGQSWLQEQWNAYEPPADFGKGWDDDVMNDCTCPDGRCQESRYYFGS